MKTKIRSTCLCIDEDRLLLIQMKDPVSGELFWYPPGGKLEAGESAHDAVHREVLEETGSRLKLLNNECVTVEYSAEWCGETYTCVNHTFVGELSCSPEARSRNRRSQPYEQEQRWVKFSEIDEYLQFSPELLRSTKEIISRHITMPISSR